MKNLCEYDRLMREHDWGNLPQKSQTMCEQLKFRVQSLYIHVHVVFHASLEKPRHALILQNLRDITKDINKLWYIM